uniref:LHY homologue2 n=1 Tax=Lemna aequinoctialis TaxID=89585 RepID=Q50K79_LEMAE|nr:LHY homologue2 [Lemna aequinoctialis]
MDVNSSGEDFVLKARKPYTITKQREKWTEEEHNKFLQALKLYGRSWQRIEEHIGSKTAVQIGSHAQKFFSKLEKEALIKGVPLGQGQGIEIPPPRPKRKPNNPYPLKTSISNGIGGLHQKKASSDEDLLGLSLFHDPSCKTKPSPDVELGRFEGLRIDTSLKKGDSKPKSISGTTSGTTTDQNAEKSMQLTASAFPPFFNMSAEFSSLVVSTLLQNPAAYATAMLAASFWPPADVDTSSDPGSDGRINPTPSIAAIAAATVAAASAWWAMHGLLPFCPPAGLFPGVFPLAPSLTVEEAGQRSKSIPSSSESDERNPANETNREPDEPRGEKKKADRSSCGSNTPSSSDMETNAVLDLEKEDLHLGPAHSPSWKEVSHQGRKAFQALFSREVLPQSFSPPKEEEGRSKPRRTGFKPYKRSSASPVHASSENDVKRLRLQNESFP